MNSGSTRGGKAGLLLLKYKRGVVGGKRTGDVNRTLLAYSTDSGKTFTPADISDGDTSIRTPVDLVAAGPKGFLAISKATYPPTVWTSADCKKWPRTAEVTGLDVNEEGLRDSAVTDEGYLLVGYDEQAERATVWRSPDAARWSAIPLPGGEPDYPNVYSVAHRDGVLLALGEQSHENVNNGFAWVSTDKGGNDLEGRHLVGGQSRQPLGHAEGQRLGGGTGHTGGRLGANHLVDEYLRQHPAGGWRFFPARTTHQPMDLRRWRHLHRGADPRVGKGFRGTRRVAGRLDLAPEWARPAPTVRGGPRLHQQRRRHIVEATAPGRSTLPPASGLQ